MGRYALKLKKKIDCHGINFCHFFIKPNIIKFFIDMNMLYKFGKDRRKIVGLRTLSFGTDGQKDARPIYSGPPELECRQGKKMHRTKRP